MTKKLYTRHAAIQTRQTMAILSQNFVSQVILLGPSVSARLHTLRVGDVETQMARLVAKTPRG